MRAFWRRLREQMSSPLPAPAAIPESAGALATQRTQDVGLVDAVMGGWFQNASNELYRGVPINANDVVLDVGCGSGGATLFCARRGAHVIFTDSDASKIRALREQVSATPARRAEGLVSDSLPLPLADGTASRVIAMEMLEHVERPGEILRELCRVGQPGALYFLTVPAAVSEQLQQPLAPASHFQTPNHINVFAPEAFAALVRESGLEIVSQQAYGFFWTIWMMFYWTVGAAEGRNFEGATHDQLAPPFHPLLDEWASVWHKAINLPGGALLRDTLDQALPKTQIILARKPGG